MTFASTRSLTASRFAASLAVLLLFGSVHAQDLQPIDRPVAIVEEDVILKSELDAAVRIIRAQYAGRTDQLPPDDVLERQVLERLVVTKLQVARAQSSGIRVTDQDIDAAIGRIAQGNNLTQDQMRQQIAATGQSWDEFRRSIRDEILV